MALFRDWEKETLRLERDELQAKLAARPENTAGTSWNELMSLGYGAPSASGQVVNAETAKKCSTANACTRLLSEAVAGLGVQVLERVGEEIREADLEAAGGIGWLLNEQPTPSCTAASFWEWNTADMLNRGDGVTRIVRDRNGEPLEFIPEARQNVTIEQYPASRRLRYFIETREYGRRGFDQDDILHFPGFGFNGIGGMSVIQFAAANAIGIALAADQHAASFWANGATPGFAVKVPGFMKPDQLASYRQELIERVSGSHNAHLPLILQGGGEINPFTINAKDSQLLESRMFQVVDVCRAYGVPPFMIGETSQTTAWGTGIEQMGLGFVRYPLRGLLTRIEHELNRKLWPKESRFFVRFNTDALMRGDSTAEGGYFRNALGGAQGPGWMSVNQVRKLKGWSPIESGDEVYRPAENATSTPAPFPAAEPDPVPPEPNEPPEPGQE